MTDLTPYFDLAVSAPDGIKKLREMILTLAMQGKLVSQDPADQPAAELLKSIAAEKNRLEKAGKIKKAKPLPPIAPEEIPYELPPSWQWVRLGEIAQHNSGKTLDKGRNSGEERDYITTSNVYWGYFVLDSLRKMPIQDNQLEKCSVKKNDLLILEGGEAGRAAVWEYDYSVCFQNHLHRARFYGNIDSKFAFRYFQKLNATNEINKYRRGVGITSMSSNTLSLLFFPLPPLAEQKRIVAKVDQLMAQCDMLEELRQRCGNQLRETHQAAIKQLLTAATASNAWDFLRRHFELFYTTAESIAELRKAILQLAVQGKLIDNIPAKTQEVALKTICSKIGSGATPLGGKTNYCTSGIPLIRSMNVHFDGFRDEGLAFIDDQQAQRLSNVIIKKDDVLLNITGASIGRVCLAPSSMEGARVNQHVCIIRLSEKILPQFLTYFLASPAIQNFITSIQVGATREALTKAKIEKINIPIYPIDLQKRIVAKVEELMALCDRFEDRLKQQSIRQTELLNTIAARCMAGSA